MQAEFRQETIQCNVHSEQEYIIYIYDAPMGQRKYCSSCYCNWVMRGQDIMKYWRTLGHDLYITDPEEFRKEFAYCRPLLMKAWPKGTRPPDNYFTEMGIWLDTEQPRKLRKV